MAGDEYSIGGGKLKLKGSKVSGGRIEKKKKKSSKKKEEDKPQNPEDKPQNADANAEQRLAKTSDEQEESDRPEEERERDAPGKTETERKYEEIRRKRVCIQYIFCCNDFDIWTATNCNSYTSDFNGKASRLTRSVCKS
jgi:protein FAM32A